MLISTGVIIDSFLYSRTLFESTLISRIFCQPFHKKRVLFTGIGSINITRLKNSLILCQIISHNEKTIIVLYQNLSSLSIPNERYPKKPKPCGFGFLTILHPGGRSCPVQPKGSRPYK